MLRPYINWAPLENPCSCYLLSSSAPLAVEITAQARQVDHLAPRVREQRELSCLPARERQEYFVQPLQPCMGPKISSWPTVAEVGAPWLDCVSMVGGHVAENGGGCLQPCPEQYC